ncbi:MAG: sulfurtransferase [Cycloclasticus sp. symbiont of Poecilosclerida sp. M]|nr:MAG: sulfurtransferase [Cycloclasticus sp. symbiont of Poecilosclerida sp. M]
MTNIQRITPVQAKEILDVETGALLIDVRTKMEYTFVGHPIGALHIPIQESPAWETLDNFIDNVTQATGKNVPLVLMCRSGVRSMKAAEILAQAGFQNLYNMEEGFEGDKDDNKHRSTTGGWRFHKLPWEQG